MRCVQNIRCVALGGFRNTGVWDAPQMAHNSARKIYMEDELDRWIGQLWAIQMKVTARSQLTIHERIQHLRRCARCQTRDLH